jgi:hypothetical protein
MFYDFEGKEISESEWSKLFSQKKRLIKKDFLDDKLMLVSTVWIGLAWDDENPPLIFETMAFPEDSYDELGSWRWATYEAALQGHQEVVDKIRHDS